MYEDFLKSDTNNNTKVEGDGMQLVKVKLLGEEEYVKKFKSNRRVRQIFLLVLCWFVGLEYLIHCDWLICFYYEKEMKWRDVEH